jgi:hypothetical protein
VPPTKCVSWSLIPGLGVLADNQLSMTLVILIPLLSVFVGLSVDCCLCCHHLRRRRAAQHRISQVKQVVTMYTVLRRAVRIRRAPPVKANDSGDNQTDDHNGNDRSSSAGWLAKAVGAMVGIKRLAGSRKGQEPVADSNQSNVHVAGDDCIANAGSSADVTVLDQSKVSATQQTALVASEDRGTLAVLSPVVAWGGNLTSDGDITSVDSWQHSLDVDETDDKVKVSGRPADTC